MALTDEDLLAYIDFLTNRLVERIQAELEKVPEEDTKA
jgi:hypothetical protein